MGHRDVQGHPLSGHRPQISGKLASCPKLDRLLARLQPGDAVVVTRLRRIGRNHKHLLELVERARGGIPWEVSIKMVRAATLAKTMKASQDDQHDTELAEARSEISQLRAEASQLGDHAADAQQRLCHRRVA